MNLKTHFLFFTFIICVNNLYPQNSKIAHRRKPAINIDTTIYLGDKTEKKASYQGGDTSLSRFFINHFKWRANTDLERRITVLVSFVVEKNGNRTYYPLNKTEENMWLSDSAFSIITKMPPFTPAVIKNKKVRSSNFIEIIFCSNKEIHIGLQSQFPDKYEPGLHIDYGDPCSSDTNDIINFAEQMPEFPGGKDSMELFIQRNLIYPENAKENGIQGRVQIQFVIWRDGGISKVKALSRKGWGLEEEAIRVVKMMPKWKPGKQNGQPVNVKLSIPMVFKPRNVK